MATLYKRYIPPKSTSAGSVAAGSSAVPTAAAVNPDLADVKDGGNKRKRERTEEEVAERKAKKLKKKGAESIVEPLEKQPVPESRVTVTEGNTAVPADHAQSANNAAKTVSRPTEARSEFAHVKNIKKRHKLEKEARKARKDTTKPMAADIASGNTTAAEPIVDEHHEHTRSDIVTISEPKAMEPEDNEAAVVHSQPKKRRHKLEKALQTSDVSQEKATDEVEHLKKHTTVLDKYQKAAKRSKDDEPGGKAIEQSEAPVLRDLVPLPQPEDAPAVPFAPDYSALPKWLANPAMVSSESKAPFSQLGLDSKTIAHLFSIGFKDALPVQQALIPLLLSPGLPGSSMLPGTEAVVPDVAVSAATGSGKTLAYLLPVVQALRAKSGLRRLKALVVVPTRELVVQVTAVAESLSRDSKLRVGAATGAGKLKDEQGRLVRHAETWEAEASLKRPVHHQVDSNVEQEEEEEETGQEGDETETARHSITERIAAYTSAVDILVCTPGRLLEHLKSTAGFNLAHLEWLVLDEADKLLDQQYDGFLETLNTELMRPRLAHEQDARERLLRANGLWDEVRERRVRKVVLSATMTTDISKLMELKLRLPRMLIVRSGENMTAVEGVFIGNEPSNGVKSMGDGFDLPPTLVEYCVPVGDGSEKPLYLVELLESKILPAGDVAAGQSLSGMKSGKSAEDEDYDSDASDSSSLSTSSSELSSSSEESVETDATSESSDAGTASEDDEASVPLASAMHPERAALLGPRLVRSGNSDEIPTILIFTSSNESATRLTYLIKNLRPDWDPLITTLTKANPTKRNTTKHATRPTITICTDRAARGLDQLNDRSITHVLQYDVPRSLTSYVHRVGRTARAGRSGEAWTLYTHSEASWFLREVTKAKTVKRAQATEKVKLELGGGDDLRERYQEVLAGMREKVYGGGNEKKAA